MEGCVNIESVDCVRLENSIMATKSNKQVGDHNIFNNFYYRDLSWMVICKN